MAVNYLNLLISGLTVLLAGRYLVEERPHMLEYILLNFLTNLSQDIEWRSLSMQHAVKTCEERVHVASICRRL